MKPFFVFVVCLLTLNVSAQITVHRKIAQRRDDFVNNNWKGIDSSVFTYNNQATLNSNTYLKTDTNSNWTYQYRYTYQLSFTEKVLEQIRENRIGNTWVNNTRYTYTYDANNHITLILYDVWNGSAWSPSGKITYTGYNSFGQFGEEIAYIYSGGAWNYLSKKTQQIPGGSNLVSSQERFTWDNNNAVWKKYERIFMSYNQDSVSIRTRMLPDTGGVWVNKTREMFNYGTSPFLLNEYVTQVWDSISAQWENDQHILYSYTGSNKVDVMIYETFNGAWNPTERSKHIYNASDSLIEFYDELNNGGWQNHTRSTYTYTGPNVTEELQYLGSGSNWNLDQRLNWSFDANGNNTYRLIEDYNGSAYAPLRRDFYYYNTYTVGLQETLLNLSALQLYPNPANQQVYVNFVTEEAMPVSIRVIDMSGKTRVLIQDFSSAGISNQVSIPCERLNAGIYLLQITNDRNGKSQTKMFTIHH
ncbi:MAG: T9SS type A sorting domain-containing protein [Chitinophagaceae bacterium]|nr:T9SS type A sorting domain-containing protein [Chitinophagaceae bacterium]